MGVSPRPYGDCNYVIPKRGKGRTWWQREHPCRNPAQKDGRCLMHNREKLERTRRKAIDRLLDKAEALGAVLELRSYGEPRS